MIASGPTSSSPPPRLGLIGLGRMGTAVCERLVAAGFEVLASDRVEERREDAVAIGAAWAAGTAAVAARSDVVVTVLPGPPEVESIAAELVGAMSPGALWLDLSTASPRAARTLAEQAGGRGVRIADAPLGGGPDRARQGRLLSFVGADRSDLPAVRAVLQALADRIVHVGPPGSGYAVKLLANSLWFGQAVAVTEALTLVKRSGLDLDTVRGALGISAGAGRFLADDVDALLAGDDLTTFALARCCEQLESVLELGDDLAVQLQLLETVRDIHRAALARYGDVDGELLGARFVAERSGVSFDPNGPRS
ncbi:MAG: NAD(P)-dependent oxidoreductase [Solirubrobacteraceae bacterium]